MLDFTGHRRDAAGAVAKQAGALLVVAGLGEASGHALISLLALNGWSAAIVNG